MLKTHVAKKAHKCTLCGKKIPAGHRYYRDYQEDELGCCVKDEKQHTNCCFYESESQELRGADHG